MICLQNLIFAVMPNKAFSDTGLKKRDFITLCRSMARLDFTYDIPKLKCPTAVVCGSKDKANLGAARRIAAALPDSKLYEFDGAGHEVNVDMPESIADIIRDFG